jgi:TRAP-type C4-dicarboxylate transport system permease small subunit
LGYLCIILLTILVIDVLAGVFFRYVLSNSLSWSGEVARYLCIWLSFIGSAILLFHRGHVGLEFLVNLFPMRVRHLLVIINNALILVFLIYTTWFGYLLTLMQVHQRSSALLISMAIPYAAVPVGCALMALAAIYNLVVDLEALIGPSGFKEQEV